MDDIDKTQDSVRRYGRVDSSEKAYVGGFIESLSLHFGCGNAMPMDASRVHLYVGIATSREDICFALHKLGFAMRYRNPEPSEQALRPYAAYEFWYRDMPEFRQQLLVFQTGQR